MTAGTSATGSIAVSLARRNVPTIFLVRPTSARDELVRHGAEHVIVTAEKDFECKLAASAAKLGTTAVID